MSELLSAMMEGSDASLSRQIVGRDFQRADPCGVMETLIWLQSPKHAAEVSMEANSIDVIVSAAGPDMWR